MSIYTYLRAKVENPRHVSLSGQEIIHWFEGFRAKAYPDPGSGGEPWTIGYGTTVYKGNPVVEGMVITKEEAAESFQKDLSKFEKAVRKAVKVSLTQHQFDALVSFTYNVGVGAFQSSTLLRKLNKGNYMGAANEFPRWNKASGKIMAGLIERRETERALFLGDRA